MAQSLLKCDIEQIPDLFSDAKIHNDPESLFKDWINQLKDEFNLLQVSLWGKLPKALPDDEFSCFFRCGDAQPEFQTFISNIAREAVFNSSQPFLKHDNPDLSSRNTSSGLYTYALADKGFISLIDSSGRLEHKATQHIVIRSIELFCEHFKTSIEHTLLKAQYLRLEQVFEDQQAITHATNDLLFKCDEKGKVLWINHAFAAFFELEQDNFNAQIEDFFDEQDCLALHEAIAQAFIKGKSYIEISCRNCAEHKLLALTFNTLFNDFYSCVVGTATFITDRKVADQRDRLISAVFENAHDGILITDLDGHIIEVNSSYLSMMGIPRNSVLGSSLFCINDLDLSAQHSIYEIVKEEGSWRGEIRKKSAAGNPILLNAKVTPIRDEQGLIESYIAFLSDQTELTTSKQALEQSENQIHQIIHNLPIPIIALNKDHEIIHWNLACEEYLGLSADEVLGTKNQWQGFYDSPRPIMADIMLEGGASEEIKRLYGNKLKQSSSIKGAYEAEDFFPHLGEHGRWLHFSACAITDASGEVTGAIETMIDITERKQAEAAVFQLNSELSQVIDAYPQPILVLDKDHRISHWNRACEQVMGVSADEMIGTKDQWKPFYPKARPLMADIIMDEENTESMIEQYYKGNYDKSPFIPGAYESEAFFPQMGAEGRWLYFTASALKDNYGNVIGAIESFIDVTQRKSAESEVYTLNKELETRVIERTQELQKANSELEHALNQLVSAEKLASLGNLVAGVAHELNTPIGNMMTVATTLRESGETFDHSVKSGALKKSTLNEFMELINDSTLLMEKSARRAEELISNFKQVAVDQTSMRRREFDLQSTTTEVLSTLGPTLKKTQIVIHNNVPANIILDSYPGPLEQVLTNLINNSLQHGFENKTDGEISISASLDDDMVTLIYADNGLGMSDEIMTKAFDPFFTTKLGSGGSGLGLYIIYNLITAVLGGEVEVSNNEGQGIAFNMKLPIVAPDTAAI